MSTKPPASIPASTGEASGADAFPAPAALPASEGNAVRIDWTVLLFAALSPLVAVAGTSWWIATGRFHLATLFLAAVMGVASGLGITAGYHRLFSHRSFEAVWPVRLVLLLLGGAAIQESALRWSWDHRRHHRLVDQAGDPYGVQRGFWHAHYLWMFRPREECADGRWPADLYKDALVRWQRRLYLPTATLIGFVVPGAIASLWGDPWGGLLVAGMARVVVNHQLTFAINSVCHWLGSQPYSDRHSARDNWVTALFTYGEGYHNFHHEFAADYRNGYRSHQYDPTKWTIYALSRLRLARNLRRARWEVIAMRRITMQEKRLRETVPVPPESDAGSLGARLGLARGRVQGAFETLQALRRQQRALHEAAGPAIRPRTRALEVEVRAARVEFERAVESWHAAAASV